MTFKEYLKEVELSVPLTLNIPSGVFGALPTTSTGSQAVPSPDRAHISGGFVGTPWHHQLFDLGLPNITKTSQIRFIDEKKNPILVHLADGTELFFPLDAFKRIKGEPRVGKMMMVVFQRRPDDKTKFPSNVKAVYCF